MTHEEIESIEIHLVLEALRMRYGYDFSNYAKDSLSRRILHCLASCTLEHVSDIIPRLIHEGAFLHRLITTLSVVVTTMFRDPPVYQTLKEKVFPVLKKRAFINIWHAGCATGEEVYSLAILLKENGLYDNAQIYATDLNDEALGIAKEGAYPTKNLDEYKSNYKESGGRKAFSDYYQKSHGQIQMDASLKKNILFANHNLATDSVFAEMHLILCRNVLIYFDKTLQERVFTLFQESLENSGFLCLGDKENMDAFTGKPHFQPVSRKHRICQKKL